ncbi:hypothetical protein GYMLUDRAFT_60144 [Collybiopsis luxurians FD-317 M1]|uniref:Cep57 centrosome microtubule-binding domain-containing protein n=1 Tax=Collybiopsis luxurians FD-317 M1 TaxID=944289 RepID=A0A0D0CAW6_9AGAR|nr:hypothetical protein GYMLUDRAFT_60144 [Collybiopsis luxurians FD-317 M1]
MKPRPTRAAASSNSFEFSHPGIPGDALEHDRIQLEENLNHLNVDFSYRASSQGDAGEGAGGGREGFELDDASIEYPRHGQSNHGDSFIRPARGDGWPYGAYAEGDDDYDGVNPYGGETMSTAAHHASALTLTAGLGGRGLRRNTGDVSQVSLSGAEYDPDRPLENILSGRELDSRFSVFDLDPSRSKYSAPGPGGFDIDPLVVDSTAELDRILASGYNHPATRPTPSSPSSSASSSDSEGRERPKISDSLRRVSFSPKRPRVATSRVTSSRHGPSPLTRQASLPPDEEVPTPRARQTIATSTAKRHISSSNPIPTTQPQVRLQPPTPSNSTNSRPAKSEKGERDREGVSVQYNHSAADSLYTNGEAENDASSFVSGTGAGTPGPKRSSASKTSLHHTPKLSHRRDPSHSNLHPSSFNASHNLSTSKLHLPDVTGLTSAVESPARPALRGGTGLRQNYLYPYKGSSEPREVEVRLLTLMNTIQDKLSHLEDENSISRRRVRELEWELEECKREVVKERTRVEKAISSVQSGKATERELELEKALADAKRKAKGKARARDTSMNNGHGGEGAHAVDASVRYKEVVEEKKALESLITTLRTHLTRLTSELSSHQELLHQLFSLREGDLNDIRKLQNDAAALHALQGDIQNMKLGAGGLEARAEEVERLRIEVERLAGEVEVLRGVVEEGLRERRMKVKDRTDASIAPADADVQSNLESAQFDKSKESEVEVEAEGQEEDEDEEDEEERSEDEDEDEDEEPEPFDPMSIPGSSRASNPANSRILDKDNDRTLPNQTIRTDHATLGTLGTPRAPTPQLNSNRAAPSAGTSTRSLFIDDDELRRIMDDVEERRSRSELEVSGTEKSHFDSRFLHPSGSISQPQSRPASPAPRPPRPEAPTPSHARASTHQHPHQRASRHTREREDGGNRASHTEEEPEPFPQIRGERLEKLFFSAPVHDERSCNMCRRHRGGEVGAFGTGRHRHHRRRDEDQEEDEGFAEGSDDAAAAPEFAPVGLDPGERAQRRLGKQRDPGLDFVEPSAYTGGSNKNRREDRDRQGNFGRYGGGREGRDSYEKRKNLPQQTILARVIRELEDDFTHYKSVYIELADQYKDMDPVSDVRRRNLLAKHLKEVVDILEQKGDQIASLYDLLTFKDKPDITRPSSEPQLGLGVAGRDGAAKLSSQPQQSSIQVAQALRAAGLGMKRHPTFA